MKMPTQMMSRACQNSAKHMRPAHDVRAEPLGEDLRHHRAEPQEADRDVQPVAADEGEEGGQERAAVRAVALGDHSGELVDLETEEAEAEQAGHDEADLRPQHVAHAGGDHGEAADEARQQQERRLDRDRLQVEELERPGAAGGRVRQHRVGRVEGREHHEVAEQEDPEAVGGDDALRRRAAVAVGRLRRACAGPAPRVRRPCTSRMPGSRPATRSSRASRLSASIRLTSSTGTSYSS